MCGRIAQSQSPSFYAEALGMRVLGLGDMAFERYNVPPGTNILTFYPNGGDVYAEQLFWGYAPAWATGKGMRPSNCATSEKMATSGFWRAAWRRGRCIIPADGWYEWPVIDGMKAPHFIRLRNGQPCLLAGIGQFPPSERKEAERDSVAVVTEPSDQGMVDVHSRRPVIFTPDIAHKWLNAELSEGEALDLARDHSIPADQFAWYRVPGAVSNSRNNDPSFVLPA